MMLVYAHGMPSSTPLAEEQRQALDLADQGQWEAAHRIAQQHEDALSCQIHGYLHRIEGDLSNAGYWYRRGGQPGVPGNGLPEESARLRALITTRPH
jgi:hypothetical protein